MSLFGASPLLASLVMLGWSASLGGFLGATAGAVTSPVSDAGSKENWLSALVRDAIASGQIVLVVDAQCEQEAAPVGEHYGTFMIEDVIALTPGDAPAS